MGNVFVVVAFFGACVGIFALWLFLIKPSRGEKRADLLPFCRFQYAHRGVFDDDTPENSFPAFQKAVAHGYGIELDVRLTKDGQLVVFHDETLERMCGLKKKVSDCTAKELAVMPLLGSPYTIPTLNEVLNIVQGKFPLVVELKEEGTNCALVEKTVNTLKGYDGLYCLESFNPFLIRHLKRHHKQLLRGQLTGVFPPKKGQPAILHFFLRHLLVNFLSRPDFIACQHGEDSTLSHRAIRTFFHPIWVVWTVRTQRDFDLMKQRYDIQIFEGFLPSDTPSPKGAPNYHE